jgi:hypothetical protein
MRLLPLSVAVTLTASSALAAETKDAQPQQPADANPPVLVQRGPSDVLAGQGVGTPKAKLRRWPIPVRRYHDVMPSPLGARDGKPLAGYHGGCFYLRDRFDSFRIYPGATLHLDSHNYFGPAVSDTDLKSTVQVRRMRLTLGGEILNTWQFMVQPEWGSTSFDNPTGTIETSAGPVGKNPDRSSATFAPVQNGVLRSTVADAYVNYGPASFFNVQLGQFQAPFTMENRTSSHTTPFNEVSLATRALGIPLSRELGAMLWGSLPKNLFYYSAGVFLGEGPNRPNADNRVDVAMRYYVRPLARSAGPLKEAQLGFSYKYGMRDKNRVAYDYTLMSTQGGFAFWRPIYFDSVIDPASANTRGRQVHVIPSGAQTGYAGELRVPFDRFDLRGEFVFIRNNTREAVDGYQFSNTERLGTLKGWAYYAQLGYWIWGKPFLSGTPGEARPPKLDLNRPDPGVPPQAVELVVRWEQLRANYDGAARDGVADARSIDGDIRVDAFSAGVNYWASRHLRLSLNYLYYSFPDSSVAGSSGQRAQAPGNRVNVDSAHSLHELTARLGAAF